MVSRSEVLSGQGIEFKAAPIPESWVISGAPAAQNHVAFVSDDRAVMTIFWRCTAGSFEWIYHDEETIYVLDGGMRLTFPDGEVRQVGAGDAVYFPAGSRAVWDIESHVSKVAVFRRPTPAIFTLLIRCHHKATSITARLGELAHRLSGRRTSRRVRIRAMGPSQQIGCSSLG